MDANKTRSEAILVLPAEGWFVFEWSDANSCRSDPPPQFGSSKARRRRTWLIYAVQIARTNLLRTDRPPRPMKKPGFRIEPEKNCLPGHTGATESVIWAAPIRRKLGWKKYCAIERHVTRQRKFVACVVYALDVFPPSDVTQSSALGIPALLPRAPLS